MRPTPAKSILKRLGKQADLAHQLGVTTSAISQWQHIPVKHVLKIEAFYGVSRYEQRPDVYGTPSHATVNTRAQ